jgi:hypothetical protein
MGANGFPNETKWLAIPLFGQIVTMGERDWGYQSDSNVALGLVVSGLFQHIGVAMLSAGISIKQTRTERVYALTPRVSSDGAGLGGSVSF